GAVVCYYSSWSTYREGNGKFEIEDIDPFLCTHAVYAFATLGDLNRITWADRYNDLCGETRNCGYQRFTALKSLNPNLKTLISIGGWNDGSIKFSNMAGSALSRSIFVNSVVNFLETHNFDGLDMDWEYPTLRGGVPEDKENYAILLEELAAALGSAGYLLTATVSSNKEVIDAAYNVPRVSAAVDAIHVMSFDFHGPWDNATHHHTILYPYPGDVDNNAYLNVDFAINYWLDQGAAPSKLVMGTATFGRTWTLDSSSNTGMRAPASQPGIAGPYTQSPGSLGYNELCERNLNSPWVVVNEPDMNEPYAYDLSLDNIWASFDDSASLVNKASYALAKNLAGVAAWSIDTDDFSGACGSGPFPLIQTIKNTFTGMKSPQHKRLAKPRVSLILSE
ncbi:hypothetical protein HAZT_HAZT002176, partial [Hyalella azteca]